MTRKSWEPAGSPGPRLTTLSKVLTLWLRLRKTHPEEAAKVWCLRERPLLLLPPIPPSIRVFSNESTPHMRWPKYRPDRDQAASILEGHRDSTLPASPKAPGWGSRVKADPNGGHLGLRSHTALGQGHCRPSKRPQEHKSHSGSGLFKSTMLRESVSSMLEINTPRISEREGHVAQLCLYSTQSCHSAIP